MLKGLYSIQIFAVSMISIGLDTKENVVETQMLGHTDFVGTDGKCRACGAPRMLHGNGYPSTLGRG